MQDVFISYAREDAARVKRLVDALAAARGWSIWWDTALRPGQQFPDAIEHAVEEARCVVVVWSPRSIASQWVVAEVSEGWERRALVPVMIEECEPPLPFRQTQAADLTGWRGAAKAPAFLALVDSIERVLATQAAPQAEELEARAARVRAHGRRVMRRRLAAGAAALAVLALGAWLYVNLGVRRAADQLAAQADALRQQVLTLNDEEKHLIWNALMQNSERLDRLNVANLLAVEAYHRARTPHTEATLRALLLISPWSDEGVDIEHEVSALAFSSDGRFVVGSGGPDDTIVWDRDAQQVSARIAHGGTGGLDSWDDKRGRRVHRGSFVMDVSPNSPVIATAGPDHDVALWEMESGRELARFAHEDTVTAVRFGPSGDVLATVTEAGVVRVWDIASKNELRRMEQGSASYWVGISPAGRYVASVAADQKARVWELASGNLVATIDPGGPVEAAAFSPDEVSVATFGEDLTTTALWDLPAGTRAWEIPMASNDAAGVVFAPDGHTVVFAGVDGLLGWWDATQHIESHTANLEEFVIAMAASADRTRIATDALEVARAWDVRTGRELRRIPYADWLTAIAISADGRYLASSGRDDYGTTSIEVTEIWPDDPAAAACKKVQRNLTRDEWREYLGETEPYREICPGAGEERSE